MILYGYLAAIRYKLVGISFVVWTLDHQKIIREYCERASE